MIKKYLPLIVFVIIVLIPTEAKKQLLARVLDSRQAEQLLNLSKPSRIGMLF